MNIAGRVALVTGAGRRVGQAIATALGAKGMRVAVHYHGSAAGANDTVNAIHAARGDARTFKADLARTDVHHALIDEVTSTFGSLDVLVNSAAIMDRTPFGEITAEQWDNIMAVN